jgi:hypothetical protein
MYDLHILRSGEVSGLFSYWYERKGRSIRLPLAPTLTMVHIIKSMNNSGKDNQNENDSWTSAPTAQDRKRKILEKRQQFFQRSQSVPSSTLDSPKSKRPMRSESIFLRRSNSLSVRSKLFPREEDSDTTNSSRRTSPNRRRCLTTQTTNTSMMLSNTTTLDTTLEATTVLEYSKSNIFQSPSSKASMTAHRSEENTFFGRVMQRTLNPGGFATPKTTASNHFNQKSNVSIKYPGQRMANHMTSPGGYGLVQMLSSVMSPFRGKTTPHDDVPQPNHGAEELWEEAPLRKILDWTIKGKIRIECHPPSCLPKNSIQESQNWIECLQYWQYPMDLSDREEDNLDLKPKSKLIASSSLSIKDMAKKMIDPVKGTKAYIPHLLRSDQGLTEIRRRRNWQEAFRCLSQKWSYRIETGDTEAYFYAATDHRVILFRPVLMGNNVTPMIVFSTTTEGFRSQLQRRGVELHSLHGISNYISAATLSGVESDLKSMNQRSDKLFSSESFEEDESLFMSDLEAIRKAQAFGETAGAEFSIKAPLPINRRSRRCSRRLGGDVEVDEEEEALLAMYLTGFDDCATVITILLNETYEDNEPLLITRMGSFQNSTTKSLATVALQQTPMNSENSWIELLGPILPCVLPSMIHVTAAVMRDDAISRQQSSPPKVNEEDDSGLGSHYFVIQTQERNPNESHRDRKCGILVNMNGSKLAAHHQDDVCSHQERVDVVVWDISRPRQITYKRDLVVDTKEMKQN